MSLIALALAVLITDAPVQQAAAATPASAPTPVQTPALPPLTTPPHDVAVLAGATVAPECGGLYNLQGRAWCVSSLLTRTGGLAEAYIADLKGKGWLVAAGDENRVVLIRRKADGVCEGLQMQAFYDTAAAPSPTALGYIGFGAVPGDVCANRPAS